jgi:nucleotide-binding universal stress UspA family protein
MYQKILVPIDGSDTAKLGLDEAVRLANDQNASLRLIHVVNEAMIFSSYEGDLYTGELLDALRASGRVILATGEAQVRGQGLAVETALLEAQGGQAGEVIVRDAKEWRADLIVLGTHGRRGIRRLVLGSDAEHVVRLTPAPVLLIRSQTA